MGMFDTLYVGKKVTKDTMFFAGTEHDVQTKDLDNNLNTYSLGDDLILRILGNDCIDGDDKQCDSHGALNDLVAAGTFTGVIRTSTWFEESKKSLHYAFTNNRLDFVAHIFTYGTYPIIGGRCSDFPDTFIIYDKDGNCTKEFITHEETDDPRIIEMWNRAMGFELGYLEQGTGKDTRVLLSDQVASTTRKHVPVKPIEGDPQERLKEAAKDVLERHKDTFKKLADK